jgi:hypothetical protein
MTEILRNPDHEANWQLQVVQLLIIGHETAQTAGGSSHPEEAED